MRKTILSNQPLMCEPLGPRDPSDGINEDRGVIADRTPDAAYLRGQLALENQVIQGEVTDGGRVVLQAME